MLDGKRSKVCSACMCSENFNLRNIIPMVQIIHGTGCCCHTLKNAVPCTLISVQDLVCITQREERQSLIVSQEEKVLCLQTLKYWQILWLSARQVYLKSPLTTS